MDYIVEGEGVLNISSKAEIGKRVRFIIKEGAVVNISDYVTLGDDVKVIATSGEVNLGPWTTIHSSCLLICENKIDIGAHCWFGQNTVIDGSGGIQVGNGVRVGMYSQLWSHVAAGERIEGCTLFGRERVIIENDVWLVGTCTVGSGVKIGRKTICLAHSNIVSSIPSEVVAAGAPAKVKPGLGFYRDVDIDEKWEMLVGWTKDYIDNNDEIKLSVTSSCMEIYYASEKLYVYKNHSDYIQKIINKQESKISLEVKCYSDINTRIVAEYVKYLSNNKARFYSEDICCH